MNIATLAFLSSTISFGCSNNESGNFIKAGDEIEKYSTNGYELKFSYDETQDKVSARVNLNGVTNTINRENLPNELLRIKNARQLFMYLNSSSARVSVLSDGAPKLYLSGYLKGGGKGEEEKKFLDKLNANLKDYENLKREEQKDVRSYVLNEVKSQNAEFKAKIEKAKTDLNRLNLILGATGAGKSTLFNYLNGMPMRIARKEAQGKKMEEAVIEVDIDKLGNQEGLVIAPIGHRFVSETTIPNFCKPKNYDVAYVDCAGEFDNKDILQSIINSYFKYDLAISAKEVKISLVVNYNDIATNRGSSFQRILKEIGGFINEENWPKFRDSRSVSLLITNAPARKKEIVEDLLNTIRQISQEVKNLGEFKEILEDVCARKALAVFLAPKMNIVEDEDGEEVEKVPAGEPYKPNGKVCSPEIINETIDKTRFMKVEGGLFKHSLQFNAQNVVNSICEDLIKEIQQVIYTVILEQYTDANEQGLDIESLKQEVESKLSKLEGTTTIDEIIKVFGIAPTLLAKYDILSKDLAEFHKISNIRDLGDKIAVVNKDIRIYLKDQLAKLNEDSLKKVLEAKANDERLLAEKESQLTEQLQKLEAQNSKIKDLESNKEIEMRKLELERVRVEMEAKAKEREAKAIRKEEKRQRDEEKKAKEEKEAKEEAKEEKEEKERKEKERKKEEKEEKEEKERKEKEANPLSQLVGAAAIGLKTFLGIPTIPKI